MIVLPLKFKIFSNKSYGYQVNQENGSKIDPHIRLNNFVNNFQLTEIVIAI